MLQALIKLAISKSADEREKAALEAVWRAADALDEADRSFPDRINANKALRGELPTKLSAAKRAQIDRYAADAETLAQETLMGFASFESARSIIGALYPAAVQQSTFWAKAYLKAHAEDRKIVQDFAACKDALRIEMEVYLNAYPLADCAG